VPRPPAPVLFIRLTAPAGLPTSWRQYLERSVVAA
jgi:hypothetical protein